MICRRIAIVTAAMVTLLAGTLPAHADSSWGGRAGPALHAADDLADIGATAFVDEPRTISLSESILDNDEYDATLGSPACTGWSGWGYHCAQIDIVEQPDDGSTVTVLPGTRDLWAQRIEVHLSRDAVAVVGVHEVRFTYRLCLPTGTCSDPATVTVPVIVSERGPGDVDHLAAAIAFVPGSAPSVALDPMRMAAVLRAQEGGALPQAAWAVATRVEAGGQRRETFLDEQGAPIEVVGSPAPGTGWLHATVQEGPIFLERVGWPGEPGAIVIRVLAPGDGGARTIALLTVTIDATPETARWTLRDRVRWWRSPWPRQSVAWTGRARVPIAFGAGAVFPARHVTADQVVTSGGGLDHRVFDSHALPPLSICQRAPGILSRPRVVGTDPAEVAVEAMRPLRALPRADRTLVVGVCDDPAQQARIRLHLRRPSKIETVSVRWRGRIIPVAPFRHARWLAIGPQGQRPRVARILSTPPGIRARVASRNRIVIRALPGLRYGVHRVRYQVRDWAGTTVGVIRVIHRR